MGQKISDEKISHEIYSGKIDCVVQSNNNHCFQNHNKVIKIPIQYENKRKRSIINQDKDYISLNDNSKQYLDDYLEDVLQEEIVKALTLLDLESFVLKGFDTEREFDILVLVPKYKLIINIEAKKGSPHKTLKNFGKAAKQSKIRFDIIKKLIKSDWMFAKTVCLSTSKQEMENLNTPKPCETCCEYIIWKDDILKGIIMII